MSAFVELFNLKKTYPTPKGPLTVVEQFNLRMHEGEMVSLIGHSGCGKSTVLSMVAGLCEITDGGVIVGPHEISGPGPDRGVVFQSPCLLPWLTAFDNVMLGVKVVFAHVSPQERQEQAEYYLHAVGLADSMHKRAKDLSQGMQQRVGLARAFALHPRMLLLDEPFGMLDSLTRLTLQQVLMDLLANNRTTALMVTHDVDEALFVSDRVVMMTNGPHATIGQIMAVPFERPRDRQAVLEHPDYYRLRGQLIGFLEDCGHQKTVKAA